jgi:hypothetical protein
MPRRGTMPGRPLVPAASVVLGTSGLADVSSACYKNNCLVRAEGGSLFRPIRAGRRHIWPLPDPARNDLRALVGVEMVLGVSRTKHGNYAS